MKSVKNESIESGVYKQMKATAEVLNEVFRPYGFALLVFDFSDNSRVNYISNAQREGMIATMKAFIAAQENRAFNQNNIQ